MSSVTVSFTDPPTSVIEFPPAIEVVVEFGDVINIDVIAGPDILTWGIKHETQAFAIGPKKGFMVVEHTGTISKVELMGDDVGSCVLDFWKVAFADFPPTIADSITGATPPTLSSERTSVDSTLVDWITSVTAGDKIYTNVVSNDLLSVTSNIFITPT